MMDKNYKVTESQMIIVKQLKDNLAQMDLVTESSKTIYKELDKYLVKRKD
jgi:hypothetical protein